jgi:hypothetical protein
MEFVGLKALGIAVVALAVVAGLVLARRWERKRITAFKAAFADDATVDVEVPTGTAPLTLRLRGRALAARVEALDDQSDNRSGTAYLWRATVDAVSVRTMVDFRLQRGTDDAVKVHSAARDVADAVLTVTNVAVAVRALFAALDVRSVELTPGGLIVDAHRHASDDPAHDGNSAADFDTHAAQQLLHATVALARALDAAVDVVVDARAATTR